MERSVVLIVEDEVLIRMGAVAIVQDAGFTVVEAANAEEAIMILESRFDVKAVFTDIHLAGSMDGLQLSHAIRGRWPPMHLIITSGLSAPTGTQLPENARFMSKPYGAEHLSAVFRALFQPSATQAD